MAKITMICPYCSNMLEMDSSSESTICTLCGNVVERIDLKKTTTNTDNFSYEPKPPKEYKIGDYTVSEEKYNEIKSLMDANNKIQAIKVFRETTNTDLVTAMKVVSDVFENDGKPKEGCYVATCIYGSYDCPEVWTLRRYRDNTLGKNLFGRMFIRTYYALSPTIVKLFGKTKWFKKMWKGKLDKMVKSLQDKGVESTPYNDIDWRK